VIRVETATDVDDELVDAFARLIPQLSSSSPPPAEHELAQVLSQPGTFVLIARDDNGSIVGTTTLVTFRIPTGVRAWIEDVVVDSAASGQRAGEKLTHAALEAAREAGAKTVDLTSRPSREAANHIYRKVGFEQRSTNVYRYTLK
jgi:ribosomal protein S18 acetylase RimI-like enzyme